MNPSNHLCLFEDRESEAETIPDEEYAFITNKREMKSNTWHVGVSNNPNLGPNINLKYFKKTYDTEEEKQFITQKIRTKKKTELCKNWELYHACFYKHECSFAHGIDELRSYTSPSAGCKNRLCKSFSEKGFCLFGLRCNYRHVFGEKRLFTYESILNQTANEVINECNKTENHDSTILQIYKRCLLKRKIIM